MDIRSGQVRSSQVRSGQNRTEQNRTEQNRTEQNRFSFIENIISPGPRGVVRKPGKMDRKGA
jgi:hypothetical protein